MDWPVYFKERLVLLNPKGFVGVATLWTPKEKIAPLMPSKVAVVGQLYTKGGIEYIVRNLWAKPSVSCLVVCGEDRTESGKALIDFFKGKKVKILDDREISKTALTTVQKKVQLVNLLGETDAKIIAQKVAKISLQPPFAPRPRFFPQPQPPSNFPSETSTFRVEAPFIGLAWLQILKTILRLGWEIPRIHIYGGKERMVLNLAVVITQEDIKKPTLYPFFPFGRKDLKNYFQEFFNPQRGDQAYTYGERLFDYQGLDQLTMMAKKLRKFPYNKGALATLWQPEIDNFPKRKPWRTPCLTLIQGICQDDRLHLTAYFRSNDMFGAWPQNAFALRKLQTVLAEKIDKKVGFLTTISCSAFIDEHNLATAQKIIEEYDQPDCQWDSRGNFVVKIEGEKIKVSHFSPDGSRVLEEFEGKTARQVFDQIIKALGVSQISHAFDLGAELQKAEIALKMGMPYNQDRALNLKI